MKKRIPSALGFGGLVCLGVSGLLGGCSSSNIEVSSYWGAGKPLSSMPSTYTWMPSGDWVAKNADLDRELRARIDDEMTRKGYRTQAGGELQLRYRTQRYVEQADVGHDSWEEGAIAVEVFAAKTGSLIWRGTGKARLNYDAPPEQSRERLEAAVKKILGQFPGASK